MRSIFLILTLISVGCLFSQSYATENQISNDNIKVVSHLVTESPQILRRSPPRSLIAPGNRGDLRDAPYPLRRFPSQSLIAPGTRHDLSKPPHALRRFPQESLIAPGNR